MKFMSKKSLKVKFIPNIHIFLSFTELKLPTDMYQVIKAQNSKKLEPYSLSGKGIFINVSKPGGSLPLSCMVKMIGSWHRSIPPLVQNGVHQSSDHSPLRAHCKQNVLKKLFQVWLTIILQKLLKLLHHQPQIFGRNLLKPQG